MGDRAAVQRDGGPVRVDRPEDVAAIVSWLLSPDARGVTGHALDQNGCAFAA